MEYNFLKFRRTELKFRSKKQKWNYIDNLLKDEPWRYKEALRTDFSERQHLTFSWAILLKYVSITFLCVSVVLLMKNAPELTGYISVGLAIISLLVSFILRNRSNNIGFAKTFTLSMMTPETLEYMKEEIIKMDEEENNG